MKTIPIFRLWTFISTSGVKDTAYTTDSIGKGWYSDNYKEGNSAHKTGIDVDSNASNRLNNIYDMAGNVWEWTYETGTTDDSVVMDDDHGHRVIRGGTYLNSNGSASNRAPTYPSFFYSLGGFRLALYIK